MLLLEQAGRCLPSERWPLELEADGQCRPSATAWETGPALSARGPVCRGQLSCGKPGGDGLAVRERSRLSQCRHKLFREGLLEGQREM